MSARFIIVLWLLRSICDINGADLYSDHISQRLVDVVAIFDSKFAKLENLLTEKDVRISLLEEKLDTEIKKKDSELTQLKRDMTMLIGKTNIPNRYKSAFTDAKEDVDIENSPTVVRQENNTRQQTFKEGNTTFTNFESTVRYDDQGIKVGRHDGSRRGDEREILKRNRRVAPTPTVAFHTKLSSPQTLVNGITIKFNEVTLDQGNGYNPHVGAYTVPESGTYVMTWKILSSIHSILKTSLEVNGVIMGTSDADSEDITDYHQATAVSVLRLNQGDVVVIRVTAANHGGMISDTISGKATFSGWKI